MTSTFSSPMEAFIITAVVTLGIVLLMIIMFVLFSVSEYSHRKKVFRKLSKEYGLRVETQKYSWNSAVVPFKLYPLSRMVGNIQGHTVCIEDLRSFPVGGTRGFVFFASTIGTSAPRMKLQTDMTLDGLKHTIYHGSILPVPDSRASYKEIKAELDQII